MATLNSGFGSRFGLEYALLVRTAKREILVCRDFRKRYYTVNPLIECGTGIEPGYVEVLLMRRWLLIFIQGALNTP